MSHADLFLARLGGESMTFQTFDDRRKRGYLAKVFHGQYPDIRNELVPLNQWKVGIFVTVNETDLAGRKTENITRVRALFADLDGSPLDPVAAADLQPHMIIESSRGRYHAYWIVDDCPLAEFSVYQKAIARRFDSDPKVHDLPRVMRLPGFYHCKDAPYPTQIIDLNWVHAYKLSQIKARLQLELRLQKTATVSSRMMTNGSQKYGATKGSRNDSLFRIACAIRGRGATWKYAVAEVMAYASSCNPPLPEEEAVRLLNHVWSRY
jgi:hypothetical protein